jgi:hypothetical protein
MTTERFNDIFTQDVLQTLFPEERADQFFEALFGDAAEGTFDIGLEFNAHSHDRLEFELHLKQRPGKCINCSLTYGLPDVFSRHPIININGLIQDIQQRLKGRANCIDWQLGFTREVSGELHIIPFTVFLDR